MTWVRSDCRRWATFLLIGLTSPPLWAQIAASFYTPVEFMQSLENKWQQPTAQNFLAQSTQQKETIQNFCSGNASLKATQRTWLQTVKAWEYLSSIAIGPVLQRRSARKIDFMPTRPRSIQQAIQTQPQDEHAMQLIGSPAKGLPALEWLLWSGSIKADTPACTYAQQVAADIQREAQAIAGSSTPVASQQASDNIEEGNAVSHAQAEKASSDMAEFINQWIGALERLRWINIEKPLRSAQTQNISPDYPRSLSRSSELVWQAEWAAIRDLALENTAANRHITLEAYMRGRGLLALADQLHTELLNTDKIIQKLRITEKKSIAHAAQQLAKLKQFAEQNMASALQINIGFSDADGD